MGDKQFAKVFRFAERKYRKENDDLHDLGHIERMLGNVERVIKLTRGKLDVNLLKVMVCLHDLPIQDIPKGTKRYFLESYIDRKKMPEILDELRIKGKERELIYDAVANHPLSIPWRKLNKNKNLYVQILQDLDSLDFFNEMRFNDWAQKRYKFLLGRVQVGISRKLFNWGKEHIRLFLNQKQLEQLI